MPSLEEFVERGQKAQAAVDREVAKAKHGPQMLPWITEPAIFYRGLVVVKERGIGLRTNRTGWHWFVYDPRVPDPMLALSMHETRRAAFDAVELEAEQRGWR